MKFNIEKLENFTIMPTDHLKDKKLSLKSKGLLSIMYSLPNEWDYTMKGLCKITNTGITQIRNVIAELEFEGYLKRVQTRNENGKFEYTYFVFVKKEKPKDITNTVVSFRRLKTALKHSTKKNNRI